MAAHVVKPAIYTEVRLAHARMLPATLVEQDEEIEFTERLYCEVTIHCFAFLSVVKPAHIENDNHSEYEWNAKSKN